MTDYLDILDQKAAAMRRYRAKKSKDPVRSARHSVGYFECQQLTDDELVARRRAQYRAYRARKAGK